MVKKRGYRIELGRSSRRCIVTRASSGRPSVAEDDGAGVSIAAFVALKPERTGSIIAMKRHCTVYPPPLHGPRHDHLRAPPADDLTDKVEYQGLKRGPAAG
jgi:hypothetical protein